MINPFLKFQPALLFLIIVLTTASNALAMPVWQSTTKKTVTPDPYFNPRFNGDETESETVARSALSPIPRRFDAESTASVPNRKLTPPREAAISESNLSVWQPPWTPVIAQASHEAKLDEKVTKVNSGIRPRFPMEPDTLSGSGSLIPIQPNTNSKTIIREQWDLNAEQVVKNDFRAEIISRPPTSRYRLDPARTQSSATSSDTGADDDNGIKNSDRSLSRTTVALTAVAQQRVATPSNVETFEPTRLLAMVGGEPIFVGDVLFEVNQMIERFMADVPESLKDAERKKIVTKILPKFIDSKMLYIGTLELLPEGADIDTILEQAGKEFDDKALPRMMASTGVKTAIEFDAQLRAQGSSLRKMRLSWSQDQLTKYFLSQRLESDSEVTHQEMLDNYRSRIDEYEVPAKSKWEQVMIRFDRAGSREEARKQIVELGNQIVYGANLAAVAKKSSHGFRAANGGQHDWTTKGALVLKELDEAIFNLPAGELSDVIQTANGFHVIRVLDRTESKYKPFLEAQVDIKKQLLEERRSAAFKKHLEKLRDRIPVEYFDLNDQNLTQTLATQ